MTSRQLPMHASLNCIVTCLWLVKHFRLHFRVTQQPPARFAFPCISSEVREEKPLTKTLARTDRSHLMCVLGQEHPSAACLHGPAEWKEGNRAHADHQVHMLITAHTCLSVGRALLGPCLHRKAVCNTHSDYNSSSLPKSRSA